jgi:hypothetical protein
LTVCEKELNKILDLELRRLISSKKILENLSHEKPTKRFLDIAHSAGKGDKLDTLKNDDGSEFGSEEQLKNYVTNFYRNLYSRDEGVGGSIKDFLGKELCNHPLITGSKLTREQKEALDSDLTFAELEKALCESNLNSAPGIDGYSNRFIKKFFTYLVARSIGV